MPAGFKGPCHCCDQITISNLIASKDWFGLIPPGNEPFVRPGVAPFGTRYLTWSTHFHWECYGGPNAGTSGDWTFSGSMGRYSGAITAADGGYTGDNPGDLLPVPLDYATVNSGSEPSIHYDFDYAPRSIRGTLDINLSNSYTLAQLKADAQELYLLRDIVDVPPNAWELIAWQIDEGYAAFGASMVFFCSGSDQSGLPDYRSSTPTIDNTFPYIKPDFKTLVDQLDTSSFLDGNAFSQQFQGQTSGLWSLCGTFYRNVFSPRNCVKVRLDGSSWDGAVGGPPLSNLITCFEKDLNSAPPHTLYLEPPDIIIDDKNENIILHHDIYLGLLPSDSGVACDCVGKPQPPFNLSAVVSGGVIVLSWDFAASDHDINFDIYRGIAPDTEGLLESHFDHSPYVDSLVTTGNTYYYKVKARNAFGVSEFSAEASVSI